MTTPTLAERLRDETPTWTLADREKQRHEAADEIDRLTATLSAAERERDALKAKIDRHDAQALLEQNGIMVGDAIVALSKETMGKLIACEAENASLRERAGRMQWQTMETAPKDGTPILLAWCPDLKRFPNLRPIMDVRMGRWAPSYRYGYAEGWVDREYYHIPHPTKWRPVPPLEEALAAEPTLSSDAK